MAILKSLLLVIVVLSSLLLVIIILLQKSKSEGLGLAFGSSTGESLFGARAGNVLSKATVTLTVIFLSASLLLGIIFSKQDKSLMSDIVEENIQVLPIENSKTDSNN
tara:strand:+ start:161 stop:481 length:321 start_codon:yes stop_codon:yes gene_type:complete